MRTYRLAKCSRCDAPPREHGVEHRRGVWASHPFVLDPEEKCDQQKAREEAERNRILYAALMKSHQWTQ